MRLVCSTERYSLVSRWLSAQVSTTWLPWVLMRRTACPSASGIALPERAGISCSMAISRSQFRRDASGETRRFRGKPPDLAGHRSMRFLKILGWIVGIFLVLVVLAGAALWFGGGRAVAWAIEHPAS